MDLPHAHLDPSHIVSLTLIFSSIIFKVRRVQKLLNLKDSTVVIFALNQP
jgi:hypothetical protein